MSVIKSYIKKTIASHLSYVLVLVVFLAFAIMVFSSFFYLQGTERRHLQRDAYNALTIAQSKIEAEMRELEMAMNSLSQSVRHYILAGGSKEDVFQYMTEITEQVLAASEYISVFDGVYGYFDVFGGLNFHNRIEIPEGFDAQQRPWYITAVKAGGKAAISPPYISVSTNDLVITYSNQILDNEGNQLGIIGFDFTLERIRDFVVKSQLTSGGYGVLVNNKEIIVHQNQEYLGMSVSEMPSAGVKIAEQMDKGTIFFERQIVSYKNDKSIIFYKRFDNGWYMGIVTPQVQYYASMWKILVVLAVIGAVMTLLLSAVLVRIVTERNRAEEQTQIMFDASPFGMSFWNRRLENINTNEESVRLFGLSSKQEYLDNFLKLSPVFQSDGTLSRETLIKNLHKAFDDGYHRFEWMHQKINGELLPCEITLVRVKYKDSYIVAGYTRDLRDVIKLAAEKENAEQSSRYKDSFLANMSHEIRTPMNVILGITEIQMQNENLPQETQEALGKIYNSGYLLLKIINDVLDLSKIEAGKLELVPVNYNVASLINDTLNLFVMHYDNKPIDILIHIDENIPLTLFGDDLRIKQILNNMLSNAFKYTDSGEILFSVDVELQETDSAENQVTLIFRVKDTGCGMSREQIDKLFEEYTRFNLDANRSVEGIGLGMSITRHIIHLMNGKIFVESEPGKGSLFTVRLPQGKVDSETLGKELTENLKQFSLGKSLNLTRTPQTITEYMPYGRILIVDDMETNLYVAKGLMELYGLSTETVTSGFDAIGRIKEGRTYDIVFMDHFMPKMDGIEAAKIIRELGYKHPIIALTANAMIGQAEIFIANGFDGFISKPIDLRQLNNVLNKFIRDKQSPEVIKAARQLKINIKDYNSEKEQNPYINKKLAETFAREAEKAVIELKKIIENNFKRKDDIQAYIIRVHSMKSALANVNESELSDYAHKLEIAGLDGNLALISDETNAFLYALNSLILKFRQMGNDDAVFPNDSEISGEDIIYLREKLLNIKTACDALNTKDAMEALEDLKKKTWSRNINDILNEISIHLEHDALKIVAVIAENTANMYKS